MLDLIYGNEALASTQIRLLHLEKIFESDVVSGTIEVVSLGRIGPSGLEYEALSYAWGEGAQSKHIDCGQHKLPITDNLCKALIQLAREKSRTLWVDQICINQKDMLERSTQVRIMAEIYRKATGVIVWLGEATSLSKSAFDWMAAGLTKVPLAHLEYRLQGHIARGRNIQNAQAITHLLERPWFCRHWVVQEVLSADLEKTMLLCGHGVVAFLDLQKVISNLYKMKVAHEFIISAEANSNAVLFMALDELRNILGCQSAGLETSPRLPLLNVLMSTSGRICSDARDKIYAIYAIVVKADLPYVPDYEKSGQRLYTDLAIHFIKKRADLSILEFSHLAADRLANLPSWVPDWSRLVPGQWKGFKEGPMKAAKYNACSSLRTSLDSAIFSYDSPVLTTYGVLVDSVDRIVHLPSRATREGRNTFSVSRNRLEAGHDIEYLFEYMTKVSSDSVNWARFWRTLVLDRSIRHADCRAADSDEKFVEAALVLLVEIFYQDQIEVTSNGRRQHKASLKLAKRTIFQVSRGSPQASMLREHQVSKMLRSLENQRALIDNIFLIITPLHREKEFCIAKSGRYGWVPYVARSKDVLAVLQGYEVPVVLRSAGNGMYQFVGDCYLDGVMDGEALKNVQKGGLVKIQLA